MLIEIRNLRKKYGKVVALDGASLSLKTGEILGFIGPNGAGKTTLIRILLGLIDKDSGDVLMHNKPIKFVKNMNDQIGYLPSEANFFPEYKVKSILKFYAKLLNKDLSYGIKLAQYFDLDLNKKVANLSYGNKKKVGIVVAFMKQANVLILDEPTTGLDPIIQKRFLDFLLEEKKKGVSIILSSHVLSDIQKVCDRVALIKQGKVLFEDRLGTLKQKSYKIIHYKPAFQFNLPGITIVENKEYMTIHYQGPIQPFLEKISKYPVEDLSIESVKLEDIFLKYYEEERK